MDELIFTPMSCRLADDELRSRSHWIVQAWQGVSAKRGARS